MSGSAAPYVPQQVLDDSGDPVPGAKINAYEAGTTTRLDTYTTSALSVANANPIIADAAGRWTAYLAAQAYKFVYTDADDVVLRTEDNVIPNSVSAGTNIDITGTAGVTLSENEVVYLSDGSAGLIAGRWYQADADAIYPSVDPVIGFVTAAIPSGTDGTIRLGGTKAGFSGLTAGGDYWISGSAGGIQNTAPARPRLVGRAINSTTLAIVVSPRHGALTGVMDIRGTAGVALSENEVVYLSDGSAGLIAGRWYQADADAIYPSVDPVIGFVPAAIPSGESGSVRLGGEILGLSGLTAGTDYYISATAGAITATAPTRARQVGRALTTTTLAINFAPTRTALTLAQVCEGRLTLTSGTAVTTADVTGAATVYFTPHVGNRVALYDGARWVTEIFAELSIALSGGTASRPHDIFLDYVDGVPALVLVVWTNDTTRATALTTQNGVLVKTGDVQQRYLGTVWADASQQAEDSFAKRHLWNYYNRAFRPMRVLESTDSWTYTLATFRQANAAAANQLDFVIGVSEDLVHAEVLVSSNNSGGGVSRSSAIGLDSTSAKATGSLGSEADGSAGNNVETHAVYTGFPGIGQHELVWLEYSEATGTTTWVGDEAAAIIQSGIVGWLMG